MPGVTASTMLRVRIAGGIMHAIMHGIMSGIVMPAGTPPVTDMRGGSDIITQRGQLGI